MKAPQAKLAYAKVAVDVPSRAVRDAFDYAIPLELASDARIGAMVSVPFGPSHRVGYVVELTEAPDVARVLPIDAVLEKGPVFDERVLALCRWVADYYLSTPAEALRLAVPPGRGRRLVRMYRLAGAEIVTEDDRAKAAALGLLRRSGSASMSAISSVVGSRAKSALAELAAEGLIEIFYETSRPAVRERIIEYATLTNEAQGRASDLCRAPKQAAIARVLGEFGSMPVPTLLSEAGASRVSLRAMLGRGFVNLERRVVERRVEGGLGPTSVRAPRRLTQAQVSALEHINAASGKHERFLLDGVTGSGKTEVYIRAVQRQLAQGRGAIILVPEISLTPQTVSRFRERLGDEVAVMHSGLALGERHDQWMGIRNGTHRVVVGARSAIFAPLRDVGIIVVDEEHDGSYKQGSSPRYHARDVAIRRARLSKCPVVLGSATPSLESLRAVELGEAVHLKLPGRVEGRAMPKIEVVDMRQEFAAGNWSIFSTPLQLAMEEALDRGEKVILFVNRRGFSSFLLCRECGYVPSCGNCAVSLVYHDRGNQMRCHHCDFTEAVPSGCPRCGSAYLKHFGIGTQRVEDEVRSSHPDVPVVRMDADTTRTKNSHARHLGRFAGAKGGVLLGTQMIAKGHDFPEVTVVGVVNADTALGLPDFRAAERTFQLLVQVGGRAGRGDVPGHVVVQTYWPEHYSISAVASGEFDGFYRQEMEIRRQIGYPPYVPMANVGFSGKNAGAVRAAAKSAAGLIESLPEGLVTLLGPAPAPLERLAGKYRWHLALKLHQEKAAKEALKPVLTRLEAHRRRGIAISIDVDPTSLM